MPETVVDERDVEADDGAAGGRPSRTARKNASEALQKVGEELLSLRAEVLAGLDLPERLADAVVEGKRLKTFGGRRRHLQYIGKLMRKLEPEAIDAIEAALSAANPGRRSARD
jgi:ribosome-associated protein